MEQITTTILGIQGLTKVGEFINLLKEAQDKGAEFIQVEHDNTHKNELFHNVKLTFLAPEKTREAIDKKIADLYVQIEILKLK
tara:strand:+ start:539 stop:787 length:249 start_codon:yes stop_codon:yes gene_type:complete